MMTADNQIANYDAVGNMPDPWSSQARTLLEAAKILRTASDAAALLAARAAVGEALPEAIFVPPTELMLRGFAVECFFKALWLKRGHKLAENGKFLGIPGAGDHELVQLADKLEFKCSQAERDVLIRLSVFVLSIGRYPIPKNWNRNRIKSMLNGGFGSPAHWVMPQDDLTFDGLVTRIETELDPEPTIAERGLT